MGRYGHHNSHSRYPKPNHHNRHNNSQNDNNVTEDWDSSKEQIQDEVEESKPSILAKIKDRYEKYNSPDARMERRKKELAKRAEKLNDLDYKVKKEKMKADIRKARQVAPLFSFGANSAISTRASIKSNPSEGRLHIPATNYGSMDKMFGIGTTQTKKVAKKPTNSWGNMNKLFGVD